ncbi:8-amino-7-oxononanoate synthase [Buchnera aphidicola str. Bp (Baizongia pistaciae)]|uniref:8-amino-7-oxononanoate synthase n=1 Tax=Buchnera aphidicola subsp. Baizongia pistaciae (strain Bp) TaxID=224915 RepID=BIOF_BUCBP|nr:8-amino-7-oxononanoate synthase [Buchnera aphidicola]Q89AK6.1 RecName: Full=8-amino-7-oxononanoate synthase; Short=AONS; AltName: Full=7-keto-8-amino-pelargonic acid synthase; Short=7-KAP synthase; Short=KAPA synthase; AltName: Full=8-amino-7-ketopelargonate synthase [Buchnera aphidicola str. Bp (Baizongia pistaciae)]AAO26996.1 8-amino-7-oxononanoate synthase [Buchnera aphidicola str. Bp (Baizongia pistaciae)]
MNWNKRINHKLNMHIFNKKFRVKVAVQKNNNRIINVNGMQYINFSSNDYLGLRNNARIVQAWKTAATRYGIGSTGSSLITGYSTIHQSLEEKLAKWLDYPKAILFISGYTANTAIISTLIQKNDRIFMDKLSHSSILEPSYNSSGKCYRFIHNNPSSLMNKFYSSSGKNPLIITEGIFSMDGDIAPLSIISSFSKKIKGLLMVDDAHGIGVSGYNGKGSCEQHRVKPDILTITFGKAFGISGAAVLCSNNIAEYLWQFSKHLMFSTAMPIAQAYAIRQALYCIQHADKLRRKLQENINFFLKNSQCLSHLLKCSHTAIQPIIIGDNEETMILSDQLKSKGIWVNAIRPPTVPNKSSRLRITLNALHTKEDIEQLIESIYKLYDR